MSRTLPLFGVSMSYFKWLLGIGSLLCLAGGITWAVLEQTDDEENEEEDMEDQSFSISLSHSLSVLLCDLFFRIVPQGPRMIKEIMMMSLSLMCPVSLLFCVM